MIAVGVQVICIYDDWFSGQPLDRAKLIRKLNLALPVRGQVYTVREVFVAPAEWALVDEKIGLRLEEIVNSPLPSPPFVSPVEPAFAITCFRPVKKTDISVFTKQLAPAPRQPELV